MEISSDDEALEVSQPRNGTVPPLSSEAVYEPASTSIHHPLPTGSIRVVIVHSGHPGQQIKCTLNVVSLADKPHFEALSYVWGERISPSVIVLDGDTFGVTPNLEEALQYLRLSTTERFLWIDALCINQSDIPERNMQVRHMHSIYSNADRVISWLGPSGENSDRAMSLIREAESHDFSTSWMEQMVQDKDLLWNGFHKVARICLRDYWNRVWIIQELAHGRDVLVVCGSATTKYTSLLTFAKVLADISPSISHDESKAFYSSLMTEFIDKDARQALQKKPGKYVEVSELVDLLPGRLCKDRRDLVYGIHSLLSSDLQQRVAISYSKTTAEVYISLTRAAIEASGYLDPIVWVATDPYQYRRGDSDIEVPSWVANWTLLEESALLEAWASLKSPAKRFSACGALNSFFNFIENESVLHTKGIVIGLVQDVVGAARVDPKIHKFNRFSFEDGVKHVKHCFDTAQTHGSVDTDDFFMTWMGGLWHGEDIDHGYLALRKARTTAVLFGLETDTRTSDEIFNHRMGTVLSRLVKRNFLLVKSGVSTDPALATSESPLSLKLKMGLASRPAKPGDVITVLFGCSTPVILRRTGNQYKVIGDVYIRGIMSGEAMKGIEDGTQDLEDFYLC